MLKALINDAGPISFDWSFVESMLSVSRLLRTLLVGLLIIAGFFTWLMTLSRLDISYAYALACASALFVTFFSVVFLHEVVSVRMWLGTLLIIFGTVLLVPRG